jgi:hypothetical protein
MAKKKKNRAKFPKRISGVKIPRAFRRFADSPVGGNVVAAGLMYGAYRMAKSDTAKSLMSNVRDQVAKADRAMGAFADDRRARSYTDDEYRSPAN